MLLGLLLHQLCSWVPKSTCNPHIQSSPYGRLLLQLFWWQSRWLLSRKQYISEQRCLCSIIYRNISHSQCSTLLIQATWNKRCMWNVHCARHSHWLPRIIPLVGSSNCKMCMYYFQIRTFLFILWIPFLAVFNNFLATNNN